MNDNHHTAIACSLGQHDLAAQQDAWRALLTDALLGATRRPTGIELRLRGDADVYERAVRLVEVERGCCGFLGWALARGDSTIVLDIAGPEGTESIFDSWEASFSNKAPA